MYYYRPKLIKYQNNRIVLTDGKNIFQAFPSQTNRLCKFICIEPKIHFFMLSFNSKVTIHHEITARLRFLMWQGPPSSLCFSSTSSAEQRVLCFSVSAFCLCYSQKRVLFHSVNVFVTLKSGYYSIL